MHASQYGQPQLGIRQIEKTNAGIHNAGVKNGGLTSAAVTNTAKTLVSNMINSSTAETDAKALAVTNKSVTSAVSFAEKEMLIKKNAVDALDLQKLEEVAHVGVKVLGEIRDPVKREGKWKFSHPVE